MSFTENLYLKRMIQQLHEENLKLKSFINEALRDPRKETTRPLFGPGSQPHEPGQDVGPGYPSLRDPRKETTRPLFGPGSSDLHPTNPLRVDDADTGSAAHPGEEGAVDDMPTNPFPVRRTGRSSKSEKYSGPEFGHSPSESKPMYEPHPLLPRIPSHRQR